MDGSRAVAPRWPAAPELLADAHLCPVCFRAVQPPSCPDCGFMFTDPRAVDVLSLGRRLVEIENKRRETIAAIRLTAALEARRVAATRARLTALAEKRAQDAAAGAAATAATAAITADSPAPLTLAVAGASAQTVIPVPVPAAVAAPAGPASPASPVGPPTAPPAVIASAGVAAPEPRRRLTVPVLLLIVGVSLVGVAAVFFLLLAWFVAGIEVRALIIGAITLAAMGAASWLRRRALTATAEGVAVLGVLLLALDAWAVRANDLFATGSVDAALYAGTAALAVGVVCRAWALFSKLRAPDVSAAVALPVGVGLLVSGLLDAAPTESFLAGLLGAAAAGLAHALPTPWSSAGRGAAALPERTTLAFVGVVSLLAAMATSLVGGVGEAAVWWSALGIVMLGAAHAHLARPRAGAHPRAGAQPLPGAPAVVGIASSVAVFAAGVFAWQLAGRAGDPVYAILIAPVVAVAVAVGVDLARTRVQGLKAAAVTSVIVAGLSLLAFLLRGLLEAQTVISESWTLWRTDGFTLPSAPADLPLAGVAAAALIAALLFAAPTLGRPVLRDVRPLVAVVVLAAGSARSGVPAVAVGVMVAAAALSVVVLARTAARVGWLAAGALAAVGAFLLATATPWLWFVSVAVAIALPLAQRAVLRPRGDGAVALAVAPVLVAAVSAVIAPAPLREMLSVITLPGDVAVGSAVALVQWVAFATLAAALLVPLDRTSRIAVAIAGELLLGMTLAATVVLAPGTPSPGTESDLALQTLLAEPVAAIVRGGLLVACLALCVTFRERMSRPVALGAAGLLSPTLAGTVSAALRTASMTDAPWAPIILVSAAIVLVLIAAIPRVFGRGGEGSRGVRLAAETGAAITVLVVAWSVAPEQAWALFALLALGFTGAAVSRGWAALPTTAADDIFATRGDGLPLRAAPRRLLVWPAVLAATLAWWSWLGDGTPGTTFTVETAAVPVGVAMVALAGALVWLRRRAEASVALGVGVAVGLGAPAVEGWQGPDVRGTLVAVIAAALCLALSAEPLRRVRPTAPVGSAVALIVVGMVAIQRAAEGGTTDAAWLLLFVGVAFASAYGHARTAPSRVSSRVYAVVAPAPPMILAAATVGLATDAPAVAGLSLGVLAVIHVASAWADRPPFGAASRWTSLASAALVSAAALVFGVFSETEWATLPFAGIVLAGAASAILRSRRRGDVWPPAESVVWIAGLVLATLPSVLAPVDPVRVWLFLAAVLAAAAAASVSPIPDEWRVRVPSALVLAGAALAMGARALSDPLLASAEAAAATAGAGAVALAVVLASTAAATRTATHPVVVAAAGAALLDAVVLLRFEGDLVPAAIAVIVGGAVAIVGAATLGLVRWRGLGGVLAVGGLVLTIAVCAIRFGLVLDRPGLEPDVWVLVAAAVTVAVVVAALRAVPTRTMGLAGGGVLAVATVVFAFAEAVLLSVQEGLDEGRSLATMSLLSATAVAGMLLRGRLGWAPPVAAMISAGAFGLLAIFGLGVTPVELVTVPPAVAGLAYGAWALRRNRAARSWPLLGPWLVLLTVPSLLHDLGESELWRVVGLGVVALALVVVGAVRRLQAPLVLGSVVLVVHAVAQLWPWISAVYVAVPWWLWLGIGGAALIFLAATYERRVRQMRAAFEAVSHLR